MAKQNDGLVHFEVCACGKHGRIVFPDGRTGGEISSKLESEQVLQYITLVERFTGTDIFPEIQPQAGLRYLQEEIEASSIRENEEDVSDYEKKELNTWNTAKLHQPNLNPADFHKVMERLWDYRVGD